MEFGPVQMLVVGFENPDFSGKVIEEIARLQEHEVIRLVDLLVVNKTKEGELESIEVSGLTKAEGEELGAKIGALIGYGAAGDEGVELGAQAGAELADSIAEEGMYSDEDRLDVAAGIPPGTAAAIALIEHRWAIPLRDAILEANGVPLDDAWIHPTDLMAVGMVARAASETAG
jgi:uncharacterized membrane protein